jgi:hypothetical protein
MHGGQLDEGYCIVNSDALERSMTPSSPSHRQKMPEGYFKGVERVAELDDGYSFQFSAKSESVGKLVEFITEERKNNPSIEFELIFQQKEGPLVLQIKGNAAKDFVKSCAPSWLFNPEYSS